MQVTVERLGKVSFTVQTRNHLVLSDQPKDNGGSDKAMTPPELFLASLGTCVGYYVVQFCETRNLDAGDMQIQVDGEMLPNPGRIGRIAIRIRLPFELEEEKAKALIRAATHCTIHNTLAHPPDVRVEITQKTLAVETQVLGR
jgi:putative redox protein